MNGFLLISHQLTSRHCTKQPRVLSPLGASGNLSRHSNGSQSAEGWRFSESSEDFCNLRLQQVEVSCDDNQTCTATCSSASVCFSFQCIPVLYLSWSFHLGVQHGLVFAFHSCHSCAFHGLSVVSVTWGGGICGFCGLGIKTTTMAELQAPFAKQQTFQEGTYWKKEGKG